MKHDTCMYVYIYIHLFIFICISIFRFIFISMFIQYTYGWAYQPTYDSGPLSPAALLEIADVASHLLNICLFCRAGPHQELTASHSWRCFILADAEIKAMAICRTKAIISSLCRSKREIAESAWHGPLISTDIH